MPSRTLNSPMNTMPMPARLQGLSRLPRKLRHDMGGFRPLVRLRFFNALARLLPDNTFSSLRTSLYRTAGFKIGPQVSILGPLRFIGDGDIRTRLTIEEGCIIAPNVTLGLDAPITLGKNVSLSPGVVLSTATHPIGFGSRRMSFHTDARPVQVESGAWVGMGSLVLAGVTIGAGCVVSAGSVVTQSTPPHTLVQGNPAAVVQKLPFGNR